MAAINEGAPDARRPGFARQKKTVIRIDMTPMVDLGFLLITFFIFTTRLSEPSSMALIMPSEEVPPTPQVLADGLALTILIDDANRVYYYNGKFGEAEKNNEIRETNYSLYLGIGEVVRKKQKEVDVSGKFKEGRRGIMLLIKPSKGANYRNIVDVLDEVLINDLKKYAIVDPSEEETSWLENQKHIKG